MIKLSNFEKLAVDKKIRVGVGYLIKVLIATCIASLLAVLCIREGFKAYRATAISTNLYGRAQANILSARLAALKYLRLNDAGLVSQVSDRMNTIELVGNQMIEHAGSDDEVLSNMRAMLTDKQAYQEAFDEVVALEGTRNQLVSEVLDVEGKKIEQLLTSIGQTAFRDRDLLASHYAGTSLRNLLLARLYAAKYIKTSSIEASDRVKEEFQMLFKNLAVLNQELQNTKRKSQAKQAGSKAKLYQQTFLKVVEAIEARDKLVLGVMDVKGPLIASNMEKYKLGNKKTQDQIGPVVQVGSLIIIILTALVGVLSFYFGRYVSEELRATSRALSGKIKESLLSLQKTSNKIINSTHQLQQNNSSLTDSLSRQSSATHETSSAATETSQSAERAKDSMHRLMELSKDVSVMTHQSGESMRSLVEAMQDISSSNEDIKQISSSLKQIEEKVAVINDIVFQTKLLSFNASVEAARAGEHGKGFAVVAEEISTLAQQSGNSANEIFKMLESHLSDVDQTVVQNTKKVEHGLAIVNKASDLLVEIEKRSQKSNEQAETVLTVSEEQTLAFGEIKEAVLEIDKITTDVDRVAKSANGVMLNLGQQSEQLEEIVDLLNSITAEDQVANSVEELNAESQAEASTNRAA
ncbi:MAG: hypothetical protein HRT45_00235 [Bdellovibrionales bacterium]|nr:hypothetical protein [Bdellovibrionales bacterium]